MRYRIIVRGAELAKSQDFNTLDAALEYFNDAIRAGHRAKIVKIGRLTGYASGRCA